MENKNSNRLGNNIIYQMLYQLVTVMTPLIVTPYLSRALGATEIGKYSYAYSIAYYFVLVAGLGITAHGSRRIAAAKNNPDELKKTFSSLFWVHITISILVLLVYIVAVFLGMNKENSTLSLIMTFYVLSAVVDVKWFFYGMENFRVTVLRSIIIKVLYVILIFVFVKTEADTSKYTFIMAFVAFFLAEASLFVMLPRYVKPGKPSIADMKEEIIPLFVLFIPSVANLLLRHFDKIMIGWLSSYEQLGFYENTDKVFTILSTAITAASDVIMPRISNLLASQNEDKANKVFRIALRVCIIVACAFSFGLISIARDFVPVFFGDDFLECVSLLSWIAPTIIMTGFSVTVRKQYLIPRYKEKVYTIASCTGLAVNLIANYIFIPRYGAMGAVYGTLIAEFTVILCQFIMIHKEFDYTPYIKDIGSFAIIGLIMYGAVQCVSKLPVGAVYLLVIEILTGVVIYCTLTLVFLKAKKDEIYVYVRTIIRKHQ